METTMNPETTGSNEATEPGSASRSKGAASVAGQTVTAGKAAPLWLVVSAFATVYIVWGSTYLGIRYAVQSIPPLIMAGGRHLTAGVVLLAFAYLRGAANPKWIEWRDAAIAGTLMLVIGNGGVSWAEQKIPSSVAALLVALTPLWMVLLDWLRPGGTRPRVLVGAGLLVGIGGVVLLARGHGEHHEAAYGWRVAALLAASVGWAAGSIFNRSARKPSSPFLGVAMQMIAGGAVLLGLAAAGGEFGQFDSSRITSISFGSWLYLTIAGSLVAYTAYVWLLHASTPARVATYAYVNPLIAVLLGCTLGREAFSHELIIAGALIIVAVALIVRGEAQQAGPQNTRLVADNSPAVPISE
jgi:drug/metabolite transporter (DMT)-like permease